MEKYVNVEEIGIIVLIWICRRKRQRVEEVVGPDKRKLKGLYAQQLQSMKILVCILNHHQLQWLTIWIIGTKSMSKLT